MYDLNTLCPKGETIRVSYCNRQYEPLFFLTSPSRSTSTLAAQTGAFTLYEVVAGTKGTLKTKKLGKGGNPTELEDRYGVKEKMLQIENSSQMK